MENGDKPVTRSELSAELTSRLGEQEERILRAVERMIRDSESRVVEQARDMQTEILRSFHTFTTSFASQIKAQRPRPAAPGR